MKRYPNRITFYLVRFDLLLELGGVVLRDEMEIGLVEIYDGWMRWSSRIPTS